MGGNSDEQPVLVVEGLTKAYDGRAVLRGVDLRLTPGRVLALLGRNGAGKTTTVECVEGFRRADDGTVRVFGLDPRTRREAVVARTGVMLQEGGAYPSASPREVVRLHAAFHRSPVDPDTLLERLGLDDVAGSRYRSLSGGEKQRVSLALALVGRPDLLILDEPTAGMDPHGRRATWELLAAERERGTSILLTSHNLEEVERLADEVAVLHDGVIVAGGSPAQLRAGAGGDRLVVVADRLDAEALASHLGVVVERAGTGRWLVHAGADRLGEVTAWCTANGVLVAGVTTAAASLEDVVLRLTEETAR